METQMNRTRPTLSAALAIAAGALLLPAGAGAAARGPLPHYEKCSPGCDILVSSQRDLPDLKPGDGKCRATGERCTLRAAVQEANARAKKSPGNVWRILVPGGHYTLTRHGVDDSASRGDLDLRFHGEVVGAGASKTTIDGDRDDRVFDTWTPGAQRIAHLTVTKGLATDGPGGAIRTGGKDYTYVQYVYASDSEAAATEAPLSGFGGGLAAIGPSIVTESTFQYNRAVNGGGVFWNAAESNLRLDTVANNHATEDGGGIYWNSEDNALADDTISSNRADGHGGGIFFSTSAGWLSLTYVTIASNTTPTGGGGGVWREVYPQEEEHPRTAAGTIIGRNGDGADCAGPGALETRGHNVDSDTSCAFGDETDVPGVQPLLGPLAYNGGPTPTRELESGSPAIDLIPCTGVSFDQRGARRPFGDGCDAGAFEVGTCCAPQEKPFIHHNPPGPPVGYCGVIVRGTRGPDVIRGNRKRNDLRGRAGDDRLFGGFQADCLHGGRGDDYIRGGEGVDHLRGNSGDDVLIGGDQEDTILGEYGADRILGGADDDHLYGGYGPDFIRGGDGYDVISGGPGDDTIDASRGSLDRVDCGSGEDTIRAKRLEHLYRCEHVHYVN
jgi:hypothetical protein